MMCEAFTSVLWQNSLLINLTFTGGGILPPPAKGLRSEDEMPLYVISFQAGFTMILKHWVDNSCTVAIEEIAGIIRNIVPSVFKGDL